jgi:hypothetical protein
MISYYKERQELQNLLGNAPVAQVGYYVYKGGKLEDTITDKLEAKTLASKLNGVVEQYVSNQKEIDDWKANRNEALNELSERFHKELRKEYDYLSDEVYQLIYNKAYEDSHSSGLDEVANEMIDLSEIALKIYKLGQDSMRAMG